MNPSSLLARLALLVALSLAALPAAAQTDSGSDEDARALFDRGRAAYEEERFEDAVRAFRRAYVLSPRYQLLYNIGQAELRAGHDDRALEAFEGYLRQAPEDAPQYSEVQERVRVLRSMGVTPSTTTATADAPQQDAEPEPETATEPEPELSASATTTSSDVGPAPWIVVGAGAALMVAGGVLMGVGYSEADRVTNAPVGSRWTELEGSADSANTLWGVGIGAAALGLAAVGAGIAWAVAGSSGESEGTGATARVQVGLGSLAVQGEF